jgi:hypothetical protein
MIGWMVMGLAQAAWWSGDWGIDPSASDDPTTALERAVATTPSAVTGGAARAYAPDGGQSTVDDEERRTEALYETLAFLGRSGRLSFLEAPEGVSLAFGGSDAVVLVPGRKWSKVVGEDGKYKLRLFDLGDRLVVERRYGSTVLNETWMAPKDDPDAAVVVVRVTGGQIGQGVEFRRVYRKL